MSQFTPRWILTFEAVTCAIPGAKNPRQTEDNFSVADLLLIESLTMVKIWQI